MNDVLTFDPDRIHAFVRRAIIVAFATGLVVALFSSGSIVVDRALGFGSARFAFASSLLVAGVSTLAFGVFPGSRTRLRTFVVLVPQLAGVVAGIVITHLLLRWLSSSAALSEGPRQFVNDAVATFGIVAVIHACAGRALNFVPLTVGLATLTVYASTAAAWHVDHPPAPFAVGVQELVLTQVACVSVALLVLRLARLTKEM